MTIFHLESFENNLFESDFSISGKTCFYGQTFSRRWIFFARLGIFFQDSCSFPCIETLLKLSDHVFQKNPTWVNNLKSQDPLWRRLLQIQFLWYTIIQNKRRSWLELHSIRNSWLTALFGVILPLNYKTEINKSWRLKNVYKVWSSSFKRSMKVNTFFDFAFYIGFSDLVINLKILIWPEKAN